MPLLDQVHRFPAARELVSLARAEMPQKGALCGAFVTLLALRANGIDVADQDDAAVAADSVLPEAGDTTWPATETGRDDYRLTLPTSSDPAATGTTAGGIARAIQNLSNGRLTVVPASGNWTVPALRRILHAAHELGNVLPIANVDTGEFAAQDTPKHELTGYLNTGDPPARRSSWRMPHFACIGGTITGDAGTLLSVVDTYPSLGEHGVHFQPIELLRAALHRPRFSPAGLLLVTPAEHHRAIRELVTTAGLRTELWED